MVDGAKAEPPKHPGSLLRPQRELLEPAQHHGAVHVQLTGQLLDLWGNVQRCTASGEERAQRKPLSAVL